VEASLSATAMRRGNRPSGKHLMPEPELQELNHLYEKLSTEERDELLQCLLIAAPRGGEAMVKVLEDELLCHATEEPTR
jgi:hypothetical protein